MRNSIEGASAAQVDAPGSPRGTPIIGKKFPKPSNTNILVCPVGGVGRIGMNWTLYGFDGKWILVDAGSMFAPRHVEGIDAIYPDPESLKAVIPRLAALIVTHAHEDHIGAIHRLWPEMKCPIYATPYAAEVIGARLRERRNGHYAKIKRFRPGDTLNIEKFKIKTVRMTHSAPECVSLAISTPLGNTVFHSGDWKFDPDPVIGKPTDFEALKKIGRRSVNAMICDSTNAHRVGETTSEADVAKGMEAVFRDSKGMVAVSIFSSNIARLKSIAEAAARTGRKVAIAGRSLVRNEEAARTAGLLDGVPEFITELWQLKDHKRNEVALICTGTQGEANAALGRLAHGDDDRLPDLMEGDVIVHSARVIPGNETDVEEIFDMLLDHGAKILQDEYNGLPLHVTGHATGNEIAEMYGMIRPMFAIPVHGEQEHLEAHAEIAKEAGVLDVAEPGEGFIYQVTRTKLIVAAKVEIKLLALLSGHGYRTATWNPVDECIEVTEPKRPKVEHRHRRRKVPANPSKQSKPRWAA